MIPLPNYDDQSFIEIMEMVRRRIPVIFPQWTDVNEHDPGITILELFAWLKEMQQYHLNRITVSAYESMLRLLGMTVSEPVAAQTCAVISDISTQCVLPRGMRFETQEHLVFECNNAVSLNGFRIQGVFVFDGTEFMDVGDMVREPGIYCHPFGQKPAEGSSALYIGLDRLDMGEEVRLYLQFNENYPVNRNPFTEESFMPMDIVWEHGTWNNDSLEFKPLEVICDRTFAFSHSGEILLRTSGEACSESPGKGLPKLYWLRARLLRKGCEENPRLESIYKDTVMLEQRETFCETVSYTLGEYKAEAVLELRSWLALRGNHIVFVRDLFGWQIHEGFSIRQERRRNEEIAVLTLNGLPVELAVDGGENIRILCYEEDFKASVIFSGSNGLPYQSFSFQCRDKVLRDKLEVMVFEETEEGHKRWTDWKFTSNLYYMGPYDRCFTYDRANEKIIFGDNEHGAVPQAGENNIMVVKCMSTRGNEGNMSSGVFEPGRVGEVLLQPFNPVKASGGKDPENVKDALDRAKSSMKQCMKAVTTEDYETLAAETPGLRVMGVRAIPFYDPGIRTAGDKQAAATVTVVAMPFNDEPFLKPDSYFLESIRSHLEKYRLITTKVNVIGPVYIKISVYAEVVLHSGSIESAELKVKKAIEAYFSGLQRGTPGEKPGFGDPVRENIIAMKIGEVQGVIRVKKVTLGVRNSDSYRDKYGNIIIPPHGLPYMGDLQIRTMI